MDTSLRAALATALLVSGVLLGSGASSAQADAQRSSVCVKARNDAVTLTVDATAYVDVLANDCFATQRAEVRVTGVPVPDRHGLSVGLNRRKKIVIRTWSSTRPGTYTATYRLVDARGRTDAARIVITVLADS